MLDIMIGEAEEAQANRARLDRRLAPLAQNADDAEAASEAARTFSALRAGQPLAAADVVAALGWERRRKDAEEAEAIAALAAASLEGPDAMPAAARTRRRAR
jgi:hypothetical protein